MSEQTDQLVWDEAISSDAQGKIFSDRDVAWIQDSNNLSYAGGQIIIDASSISNQDRLQSWSESYLEIPLVLSLSATANTAGFGAATLPFAMALKSGFHQLIHSIDVQMNGQSVSQLTPYTNMWTSFRMVTGLSADDVAKLSSSFGYSKDSSLSFRYSPFNTPTADGVGVCNNRNNWVTGNVATATAVQEVFNDGLPRRQRETGYDPTQAPFSTFMNAQNAATLGKSYYVSAGGDSGYKAVFVVAKIRLKDICPLFENMPLIKGANFRFTINLNLATTTITTGVGPTLSTTAGGITLQGGTNPIMIASAAATNGSASLPSAAATYLLNLSVARVQSASLASNGLTHPTLQAARLYVPLYQMNPEYLNQYLTLGTKRKVKYTDCMQFTVVNTPAGGQINALISNGVVNPKRLIVIPFLAAATAGSFSPFLSPFDTAPATTTPCVGLTNLNVQVGGLNILSQNMQYDYEAFLGELGTTGLNGALTTGLTSGLISEIDFSTSYRYYVFNISRRINSEDGTPKSIQLLGTNASQVALDLYCFVEFEREITVDTITGQIHQ